MTHRIAKKIVFWSHRNRPSFTMRGRQVAERLARRGHDCRWVIGPAWWVLRDIRDSLIVCVKSESRFLSVWQSRGNRVVLDAIDHQAGAPIAAYDAVLCASHHVREQVEHLRNSAIVEVFYHHADPLIQTNVVDHNVFRLAYIGEIGNSSAIRGSIPELCRVDFKKPGWQERLRAFNGHFSARLDTGKSVVKLANSAAADALFLSGKEPGVVELLGADYPFYLNSLADRDLAESVRRLAGELGSPEWQQALERMREVGQKLTLDQTANQYEALFSRLLG
ncbi:MAG: hypothetical protein SGI86_14215 [Deltaproteobacteria bacterium]|nr:hypothetical protein [Deltaproteobacteria bacterium]